MYNVHVHKPAKAQETLVKFEKTESHTI